jgi:hypothetical protein
MTLFLLVNIVILGVLTYIAIGALLTSARISMMKTVRHYRVSHQ